MIGRGLLFWLVVLCVTCRGAGVQFTPVALSGQPVPGANAVFSQFYPAWSNAAGQLAFRADISGAGIDSSNIRGIWATAPEALRLVTRLGDDAPGTSSPFASLQIRGIDTAGNVSFWGLVDAPAFPGVLAIDQNGIQSLIAGPGMAAPGTSAGTTFGGVDANFTSPAGHLALRGWLVGNGVTDENRFGIWGGSAGQLSLLLRQGDDAPQFGAGVKHDDVLDLQPPNADGQFLFRTLLAGPGIAVTTRETLWLSGAQPVLVGRTGDPASGAGANVHFAGFYGGAINGAGHIAFGAAFEGIGNNSSGQGVWIGPAGSPMLLARSNQPAPDAPAGVAFSWFDQFQIDAAGRAVFWATTSAGEGLWVGVPGSLHGLAITGQTAPDANGATFAVVDDGPFLSSSGQFLFTSQLAGTVSAGDDRALYLADTLGTLDMLLREGDSIVVGPGDQRQVASFRLGPLSGDKFGVLISFTDSSSGIFLATIPEPRGIALVAIGAGIMLRRLRNARKRAQPRACPA